MMSMLAPVAVWRAVGERERRPGALVDLVRSSTSSSSDAVLHLVAAEDVRRLGRVLRFVAGCPLRRSRCRPRSICGVTVRSVTRHSSTDGISAIRLSAREQRPRPASSSPRCRRSERSGCGRRTGQLAERRRVVAAAAPSCAAGRCRRGPGRRRTTRRSGGCCAACQVAFAEYDSDLRSRSTSPRLRAGSPPARRTSCAPTAGRSRRRRTTRSSRSGRRPRCRRRTAACRSGVHGAVGRLDLRRSPLPRPSGRM